MHVSTDIYTCGNNKELQYKYCFGAKISSAKGRKTLQQVVTSKKLM